MTITRMVARTVLLISGVLSLLHVKSSMAQMNNHERKKVIQMQEAAPPSPEALARKEKSIVRLKAEGVPTIAHLPVIEDSKEAKKRTAEDIAKRAIAVCIAAVNGAQDDQALVDSLVKKYGADQFFSPEEAAFIKNPKPTEKDRVKFSWRYEDYWVFLWALGYVDKLDRPEKICDVSKAISFLRERTTEQFIKDTKLRPLSEILDEADLIYRYHWATTDARVNGKDAPAKLDGGVVMERHYALNWLIGYMNQEWDDISTDT